MGKKEEFKVLILLVFVILLISAVILMNWSDVSITGYEVYENESQANQTNETIGQNITTDDVDNDGINDSLDNCKNISNSNQTDKDKDGIGDLCDNCPDTAGPGQIIEYLDPSYEIIIDSDGSQGEYVQKWNLSINNETGFYVRLIDYEQKGVKTGVALGGKKVHILNSDSNLRCSSQYVFEYGARTMDVAPFRSDYEDHIFANGLVFDNLCNNIISSSSSGCANDALAKDLDGDGTPEFIAQGAAYFLDGSSWKTLFTFPIVKNCMAEVKSWMDGFCYVNYCESVVCLDAEGNQKIYDQVRVNDTGCTRSVGIGDFDGDGIKDEIVSVDKISDENNQVITMLPNAISSDYEDSVDQFDPATKEDEFLSEFNHNLAVYYANGDVLWKREGLVTSLGNTRSLDIDNDANPEIVIVGGYTFKGLHIFNGQDGTLLYSNSIDASADSRVGYSPAMDVGDIDEDGCEEIVYSGADGNVYAYEYSPCPSTKYKTETYEFTINESAEDIYSLDIGWKGNCANFPGAKDRINLYIWNNVQNDWELIGQDKITADCSVSGVLFNPSVYINENKIKLLSKVRKTFASEAQGVINLNVALIGPSDQTDTDGDGIGDACDRINKKSVNINLDDIEIIEDGRKVIIKDKNGNILEFEWTKDEILNLPDVIINIIKEKYGGAEIKGLDLGNGTKTIWIDKILADDQICIKDVENAEVEDMTDDCSGYNEILLKCPGSKGSYECEKSSGKYKISGLKNSAVREIEEEEDDGSSGGSGGSGGGSSTVYECEPYWHCSDWGECKNNKKYRDCIDFNECYTTKGKPTEIMACTVKGEQEEEIVEIPEEAIKEEIVEPVPIQGQSLKEVDAEEDSYNSNIFIMIIPFLLFIGLITIIVLYFKKRVY